MASINSPTALTLSQSAGTQSFVPYSFTIPAAGNVLTGCLNDDNTTISSGVYTLQFTVTPPSGGSPSNFNMPLTVVGQDTQDNGTYSVYSGGTGFGTLPPSGDQQGVVTPGQSINHTLQATSPTATRALAVISCLGLTALLHKSVALPLA